MFELWGLLVILIACPLLGALPLIGWITQATSKRQLAKIDPVNISVSSAFYYGGTLAGLLAVFSEAFRGIAAVLLARAFFGYGSAWELVALIAMVIGRYWVGRGAGTTNIIWGFAVHDPLAAVFVFLLISASFTILRSRQLAKFGILVLFPLIVALLHIEDMPRILAAVTLAALLGWIYQKMPDDLSIQAKQKQAESQASLQFLRNEQIILSLDDDLDAALVGHKAARLAEIKRWGYPVPKGWVLAPFDDPTPLIELIQPSDLSPLVVRASAIGEDTELSSGAGQYETVLNVTTKLGLQQAIARVRASYNRPTAVQYRGDRALEEAGMAVLIQQQVQGVFCGVAFTRDPMTEQGDAVIIEALPGYATSFSEGTLEHYRAFVMDTKNFTNVQLEGAGRVPQALIKQVAYLARRLEERYYGIPQDIEWSYDGQTLWVLQARPISTLLPIWTRKLAVEVITGLIHPLTWSINRPLIAGVWGGIFAVLLGERSVGLDFNKTATLHYSRAYLNATLVGEILVRVGLPPESFEFFTKAAKMGKLPLDTTLRNLPGLLRLLWRELCLEMDFNWDYRRRFIPALSQLAQELLEDLEPTRLLVRIDYILELLRRATYYSVMAPLSETLRTSIFHVKKGDIDRSLTPQVAALRSLQELAATAKQVLLEFDPERVFEKLAKTPEGQDVLTKFDKLLQRYGYLSEVRADIAFPTWKEEPEPIKQLFVQLMHLNEPPQPPKYPSKGGFLQRRVNLNGKVMEVYARLLAELRWCFVALEQVWLSTGLLEQPGDIFFLEIDEVRRLLEGFEPEFVEQLQELVQLRRSQEAENSHLNPVPVLVYGNHPPAAVFRTAISDPDHALQGIPASPGKVEGRVKVLRNLEALPEIDQNTILVVPYTYSGWTSLLIKASGLIAESSGRLSPGAILAREYGIPAVINVRNATWILQDGQRVRIDGYTGIVEISNDLRPE